MACTVNQHIQFKVIITEIAPREVCRTQDYHGSSRTFYEYHLTVKLLSPGIIPSQLYLTSCFIKDLPGNRSVRNTNLFIAKGVFIWVQDNTYINAPIGGICQGPDNLSLRELKHGYIDIVSGYCSFNLVKDGFTYGLFRDYLRAKSFILIIIPAYINLRQPFAGE